MGAHSRISDLDLLILSDDEKPTPFLKIENDEESEHDCDSLQGGSDSSYEAKAKACAGEMDGLIAEAKMEREEKDRRIRQARLDKLKERDDKQNNFGRKFNTSRDGGTGSGTQFKTASNPAVKFNKKPTGGKQPKKNRNATQTKTETFQTGNNTKAICKEVVGELCKNEMKNVAQNSLSSRFKNVTIQDFDVDSTDTCSDYDTGSDFETDRAERMICKQPKTFTIKHLNKAEMLDLEEFFDSDESDEKPADQKRCYYSAEKSSAASRRKKSNYLNKRRSKFKKPNSTLGNQSECADSNKSDLPINGEPEIECGKSRIKANSPSKNVKQSKPNRSGIVNTANNPESTSAGANQTAGQNDWPCISSFKPTKNKPDNRPNRSDIVNTVNNAGSTRVGGNWTAVQNDWPCITNFKPTKNKPDNNYKKQIKSKNVSHNSSQPEPTSQPTDSFRNPVESNADLNFTDKVKPKSKNKKNTSKSAYTDMKLRYEKESELKRLNEGRLIPKYSSYTSYDKKDDVDADDIVILREISLINDNSNKESKPQTVCAEQLLHLDNEPSHSSKDEIDSKTTKNISENSTTLPKLILSSDSEDIDFKMIVDLRNQGLNESKVRSSKDDDPKNVISKHDDSSDFDEELNACLVKFK